MKIKNNMKVIDLFAGVGGMSLGFEQAGFEIVYANEYNESIANAYKKNHPGTVVDNRDIKDIDFNEVFKPYTGKIDVVVGGPPCQGFSQKGKRIGLSDDRNFMFQQFLKVVKIVKPKFFVLENVPNILSSENGFFKDEIISTFKELGYDIKSKVLKAENFGVPQKRRRAIFLGKLGNLDFEIPEGNGETTSVKEALSDLPIFKSGEGSDSQQYRSAPNNSFQKIMRKNSKIVDNHFSTNHSKIALERLSCIKVGDTKEDLPKEHRTKSIHSGTWTRMNPDGFARTITTRFDTPSSGQFTLPDQDRCITVREAARLQSFPDSFIFAGTKSSQMLQVGNAVPPMLANEIAKAIKKHL